MPLLDSNASHIPRERTAIKRHSCSKPISIALADGIVARSTTVLDFGCGHGADVCYLESRQIKARGWDPHFSPDRKNLRPTDIVNLGYVLNVIENPTERDQVLRQAFDLATRALVVAVRVDRQLDGTRRYSDGFLTGTGTFQKIYSQDEFREYLERMLGVRAQIATLGVAYLFKDAELEQRFLASRVFVRGLEYRTELIQEFARNATARRFVALANRLGRVPLQEEFRGYQKLLELFGSSERIERLLLRHVDRTAFEGSRANRRDDILTYLAMLRFQGMTAPPLGALPASIREDLRASWRTYSEARAEAERFLFGLGKPGTVQAACQASPVGKRLPEDLYVHRSAEGEIPATLRLVLFAARQIVGEVDYDLVKFSFHGRSLSFLAYEAFDTDPHPALLHSIRVYLPLGQYQIRDYSSRDNPPILHRKEAFVGSNHPRHSEFRALTEREEALGLLSSSDIGHRREWHALLATRGIRLRGHQIDVPSRPREQLNAP